MPRLSVHRTPRNIYAQLIMPDGKVVASASTLSKELREEIKKECDSGGNVKAAIVIGKTIAAKVKDLGIIKISFDRSGFRYHGRVKALADAARENGLEF
jgi:large subunit ribosomal protein L18